MTEVINSGIESRLFDNLMTVEELAVALRLKPQTVRNKVARREIPFVRVGRKTMFLRASVEAWLTQNEVMPCQ